MEKIDKIKITDFGKRHFDTKFGGTKITDKSIEEFEDWVNSELQSYYKIRSGDASRRPTDIVKIIPGYADFCKLVCLKNKTNAKTGSLPITLENYQYLRSGYFSRTPDELSVMDRWFELPLTAPIAEYLMIVLYSKDQIDKEENARTEKENTSKVIANMRTPSLFIPFNASYGIVAILGQMHSEEEPMKPITMMRNSLGISEGGSGFSIDKIKYNQSVEFWSKNATLKS